MARYIVTNTRTGEILSPSLLWMTPKAKKRTTKRHARFTNPMSNTQRYKMCENAVTTNVIRDVFARLLESIA